jgi:hypothetical protein
MSPAAEPTAPPTGLIKQAMLVIAPTRAPEPNDFKAVALPWLPSLAQAGAQTLNRKISAVKRLTHLVVFLKKLKNKKSYFFI